MSSKLIFVGELAAVKELAVKNRFVQGEVCRRTGCHEGTVCRRMVSVGNSSLVSYIYRVHFFQRVSCHGVQFRKGVMYVRHD